ncbi:MAG: thiamine phosphate synthase [Kofleriaceae bacterium]
MRGFYAVLDRDDPELARQLVGAGGAKILQVRLKPGTADEQLRLARLARAICDEHGALLIVNDRIDVALAAGADGVHLGQTDIPLAAARALAPKLLIGISTHDLAQVRAAVAGGADYLGYGPVYATRTKANPDPVQGLAALRAAVTAAGPTPIVAIGGIAPGHAREVYAAGAAAICAISAVNDAGDAGDAGDVVAAARAFAPTPAPRL